MTLNSGIDSIAKLFSCACWLISLGCEVFKMHGFLHFECSSEPNTPPAAQQVLTLYETRFCSVNSAAEAMWNKFWFAHCCLLKFCCILDVQHWVGNYFTCHCIIEIHIACSDPAIRGDVDLLEVG